MTGLFVLSLPVMEKIAHAQNTADNTDPRADKDGYVPYIASENPMGWNFPYVFMADSKDPAYAIAFKAMAPTYKGKLDYNPTPLIGIGQINLNKGSTPEIIAFPTEEEEEAGNYCNLGTLCPHYVIETDGKEARTLGVLFGWKVNRGVRILNGYYTLQVYNHPDKDKAFDEYAYDPNKKEYTPVIK